MLGRLHGRLTRARWIIPNCTGILPCNRAFLALRRQCSIRYPLQERRLVKGGRQLLTDRFGSLSTWPAVKGRAERRLALRLHPLTYTNLLPRALIQRPVGEAPARRN